MVEVNAIIFYTCELRYEDSMQYKLSKKPKPQVWISLDAEFKDRRINRSLVSHRPNLLDSGSHSQDSTDASMAGLGPGGLDDHPNHPYRCGHFAEFMIV